MAEQIDEYRDEGLRALEQIEGLFPASVAGGARDREAISRLTRWVTDLNAGEEARREVADLSAAKVDESPHQCPHSLRGTR